MESLGCGDEFTNSFRIFSASFFRLSLFLSCSNCVIVLPVNKNVKCIMRAVIIPNFFSLHIPGMNKLVGVGGQIRMYVFAMYVLGPCLHFYCASRHFQYSAQKVAVVLSVATGAAQRDSACFVVFFNITKTYYLITRLFL